MWVFGYGSLIWKADFPYEKKLVGYIKGYVRRFYQKSVNHRGCPNKPGRVTTLVPSNNPDDQVWGLAYKIAASDIKNVVNHLDFRERDGYIRKTVLFYPCKPPEYIDGRVLISRDSYDSTPLLPMTPLPSEQTPFHLTIYIAEENNPNFIDFEDLDTIAKTICEAVGPSGENREYLYKLAAAMRIIAPNIEDEHLFELEEVTRRHERSMAHEIAQLRMRKCLCSENH